MASDFKFKFGDRVELANPRDTEDHYVGLLGIVVDSEYDEDLRAYMVWFEGDYEAETRYENEIKLREEER
ncbi:hypothetical protein [Bacillus pretiosus]|uniref:DUF2187 domain-containing protein n=1 Tax=Bacillus pretiosus TaxID=2983392 RepID=A0ABT3EZJ5_9BACI|nr:hypothetical protein [Bacillus pretiosus]MCW1241966.1 hypothetical protein [Bacillus pretiosus]